MFQKLKHDLGDLIFIVNFIKKKKEILSIKKNYIYKMKFVNIHLV